MKLFFSCLIMSLMVGSSFAQQSTNLLFVGTYTDGKPDKGIYVYSLNPETGELIKKANAENIVNPSFLTISVNGRYLYACTDTKMPTVGTVTSFSIDTLNGTLSQIDKQSCGGSNPVYISTNNTGQFVVTANYTDGSVSVLPTNMEGRLFPFVQIQFFKDSSINKVRQDRSHIHSAVFSPDYKYLYLPDLGADKIRAFKFSENQSKPLVQAADITVNTEKGTGPRHLVFHPNKHFAYCTEEMGGMVSCYKYKKGKLTTIQRICSNVKQLNKDYSTADVHISPDGLFLYTSNRIENTIAIFSIEKDGKLKLLGHQYTLGETPRNFVIDPTGKFLLVANQTTNNIVVFARDTTSGLLKPTGYEVKVPTPTCLQMRNYSK